MKGFIFKARAMAYIHKLDDVQLSILCDIAQKDLKERRRKHNERNKKAKGKENNLKNC